MDFVMNALLQNLLSPLRIEGGRLSINAKAKRQSLALLAYLVMLYSLPSIAEPYHWEVNAYPNGWQGVNYPSAEATCDIDGFTSSTERLVYRGLKFTAPDTAECVYDYYLYGEYRGQTNVNASTHRFGDNCGANTSYNPKTGACDGIPADLGKRCDGEASLDDPKIRQLDASCKPLSQSTAQRGIPTSQSCPVSGDPINFSVGNSFQTETDYSNGKELELRRFYNSIDGAWRHNYSDNLRLGENFVTVEAHDGSEINFNIQGSSISSASPRSGRLEKTPDYWIYTSPDRRKLTFDRRGKLIRVDQPSGTYQVIQDYGTLLRINSSTGASFSLYEDGLHQPQTLTVGGLSITYTYTNLQRLESVTRAYAPSGKTEKRSYLYDGDSRRLTGIIDERGIRSVTWTYDAKGRATSSAFTNGIGKVAIRYNTDGTTTVTNELGKETTFHFELINGTKHISRIEGEPTANCPESNASYTYDQRGLMASKTNAKGFTTQYTYNDQGLEISRTEAFGTPIARTTTIDWDTSRLLPLRKVTPDQTITYTYDTQGRLLSQQTTANQ